MLHSTASTVRPANNNPNSSGDVNNVISTPAAHFDTNINYTPGLNNLDATLPPEDVAEDVNTTPTHFVVEEDVSKKDRCESVATVAGGNASNIISGGNASNDQVVAAHHGEVSQHREIGGGGDMNIKTPNNSSRERSGNPVEEDTVNLAHQKGNNSELESTPNFGASVANLSLNASVVSSVNSSMFIHGTTGDNAVLCTNNSQESDHVEAAGAPLFSPQAQEEGSYRAANLDTITAAPAAGEVKILVPGTGTSSSQPRWAGNQAVINGVQAPAESTHHGDSSCSSQGATPPKPALPDGEEVLQFIVSRGGTVRRRYILDYKLESARGKVRADTGPSWNL